MSQLHAPAESQQYRQPTTGTQTGTGDGQMMQQSGGQTPAAGGGTAAQGPVGRRYPTRSFLSEEVRTTSIGMLNRSLADLTTVTMQLQDAHWNVKGIHFYQLHELFEDLVDTFEAHQDTVAERASALGGQALGTPQDVVANTSIPPLSRQAFDGQSLLAELADRLARLDAELCQQIEAAADVDPDTADLLNEVSRDVSKALWFLEAHLQGPGAGGQVGMTQAARAGGMSGFQQTTFGGQQPDSQWDTQGLQ